MPSGIFLSETFSFILDDIIVNGDPWSSQPDPNVLSGWQVQLFFDQLDSLYSMSPRPVDAERHSRQEIWDPDGDEDGDGILNQFEQIVVSGSQAQVYAAQVAYQRAFLELTAWGAIGAGQFSHLSATGYLSAELQGFAGGAAFVAGASDTFEAIVESYAESLYAADGADGTYDGQIGPDNQASWHYDHPSF